MRLILTIFAVLAAVLSSAAAGEKDFVSLFDGKTLEGWKATSEHPGSFLVENGELVVRGDRAHLFYDGPVAGAKFKNFELRLKVMTTPGSNSGVYFHTAYQAEGWPDKGFEAQVNSSHSDPRKTGGLYDVADIYVPSKDEEPFIVRLVKGDIQASHPTAPSVDGKWFDYTIIVKDKTITVKVDGETTVQWTQPDEWPREGRRIDEGAFALQAHDPNSEVHYKNIRVKVLD